MTIFTIGFTRKSAETFFGTLQEAGVRRLIDIRLNNSSQLAGFTKKDDLAYFTKAICGIDYLHLLELAPTAQVLDPYRDDKKHGWEAFEKKFLHLLKSRRVEETVPKRTVDGGCLLCSEETADHCHRRLVAEYLQEKWRSVTIRHL
jgi:uncharacterized protein (DUF488 family)